MPKPKNCYNCCSQNIKKTLVDLPYFFNITVKNVPAYQCQQCKEVVFNKKILQEIEEALEKWKKKAINNTVPFKKLLE